MELSKIFLIPCLIHVEKHREWDSTSYMQVQQEFKVVAQKVKEVELTHGQQDSLLLIYISQRLTIQFSLFLSS
ncbi:hypothetical protein POPTR_017G031450v4 [Populus trichocarpa]|uniref:Uncharacterized protein n=1 Tax=Populus trichocarpa TaxID=3694 RepID=A0A3N7G6B8_POPTR|nr:hypothetical protein POPTR_017G031450v4 [Populus trichocarpa]